MSATQDSTAADRRCEVDLQAASDLSGQTETAEGMRRLLRAVPGAKGRTLTVIAWQQETSRAVTYGPASTTCILQPGQIVVMAIVDSWEQAPGALTAINAALERGKK